MRCPNFDCDLEVIETETLGEYGFNAMSFTQLDEKIGDRDACINTGINNMGRDGTTSYLEIYYHD